MKFNPQSPTRDGNPPRLRKSKGMAGFTLAEALAALTFMAIVIPVAVEGLRIASLAGVVAERKAGATRVADRLLNEIVITGRWQSASTGGTVQEGNQTYNWQLQNRTWLQDSIKQLTLILRYEVQGQSYDVKLSTLVDTTVSTGTTTTTTSSTSSGAKP